MKLEFKKSRRILVLTLFILLQGCAFQSTLDSAIMSGIEPLDDAVILEAKNAGRLNAFDANGETPLLKAVALRQIENVRRLLALGADPDLTSDQRNTPLGEVVMYGSSQSSLIVARLLLESGAEVDLANALGANPLLLAAQHGHFDLVRLLIERGANVNKLQGLPASETALLNAVIGGHVSTVSILLDAGASPDRSGSTIEKPLGWVAHNGSPSNRVEIAILLLDAGAAIDDRNRLGMTPLGLAAQKGNLDLVRLLLQRGAEVERRIGSDFSETALLNAAYYGRAAVVSELLDHGADPDFLHTPSGKTVSQLARENGHPEVVALLKRKRNAEQYERAPDPERLSAVAIPVVKAHFGKYSNRIALVIGNARYEGIASLPNARNDAQSVHVALSTAGFEVRYLQDASLRTMVSAVRIFADAIRDADVSAFYYAGHAVQVDGENFLLPTDADVRNSRELPFEAFPMERLLSSFAGARTSLNMVFLDACRNNPYGFARGAARGIATMSSPSATLISFATAPDEIADEGDGNHSPYTKLLTKGILTRGISLSDLIHYVQAGVRDQTEGRQRPWVQYDVLPQDFVFIPD